MHSPASLHFLQFSLNSEHRKHYYYPEGQVIYLQEVVDASHSYPELQVVH